MKTVEMKGKGEGVTVKQGPEERKASAAPIEKERREAEAP